MKENTGIWGKLRKCSYLAHPGVRGWLRPWRTFWKCWWPLTWRLKELNLYPLEVRRARGDVIETFKILNGFEDIDASELFTLSDAITRGHMKKIYKKRLMKGLNLRKFFFSQRVVDNWNNLPEYVISSAVVDTTFVDIYVDTKNIPTCRYNIQHIDKRTMEK